MEDYVIKNKKQLRYGITTGTCAAAAASAAAELLITGIKKEFVVVKTPKGKDINVKVNFCYGNENEAEFMVIKDSGDDPDVTNHCEIHVKVEKTEFVKGNVFKDENYKNIFLDGGTGVGRVTKKGLEQDMGYAAINAVPRSMIFKAVGEVCQREDYRGCVKVTVIVPEGERLALKTFNPRLGIMGGISILGTSGILEPMSEKAIVDTIETEMRQLRALGNESILVTPGNYGRGYVSNYLGFDMNKSIKCSNFIGDTIDLAVVYGFKNFLLVGNMGKLVKTAAGIMNTHSKTADARGDIFALHTMLVGGSVETAEKIMKCINTDEMLDILEKKGIREKVTESILKKIYEHFKYRIGNDMNFGVMVFSEKYGFLGETQGTEDILKFFKTF